MIYKALKEYGLKYEQEFMFSVKFLECYYCKVDKDGKFYVNIDGKWWEDVKLGLKFMNSNGQVINVNKNEFDHYPKITTDLQYYILN